ncbi:putative GMC oxidoreductase [Daldinia caldariorum]|uniref:putative GMC oxidoreductase n=1 Tax=Daldinia caldariorum TaxID=326644 RepID=UPI002008AFFB|nr:putative GMC oxidoreductase [Daldinia caldariorum]KAI1465486.1 putative GMC oxidoreductase [Daldinia caldariorum]
MSEVFDVVIAGGGTAGLALAARLSEDPGLQVLVLEAGEDLTEDPRVNTPFLASSLVHSSADWQFRTVPQAGLGNREICVPLGRLLGGSSALDYFLFSAPSKRNVEAWSALGNYGWDWPSFSDSLRRTYTLTKTSGEVVGDGPLELSFPEDTEWLRVWKETLANLGYPTSLDSLSGEFYGAYLSAISVDAATKHRSYSANAYLLRARSRQNLVVYTETLVEKVIFGGSEPLRATGVQYNQGGLTKIATARKEVVLSAGAINSPKILELSGVGDSELLKSLGIDVVIDNKHVGENLQSHPSVSMCFEVVDQEGFETLDGILRGEAPAFAAAQADYDKQIGFGTRGNLEVAAQLPVPGIETPEVKQEIEKLLDDKRVGGDNGNGGNASGKTTEAFASAHEKFVRSVLTSPTEPSATYYTIPGFAPSAADGAIVGPPPGHEKYYSATITLSYPLSRGSVHIASSSPPSSSPPPTPSPSAFSHAIDPAYLSHPLDLEILARHLSFLQHAIISTTPFSKQVVPGGKRFPDDTTQAPTPTPSPLLLDAARRYVRDWATGSHAFAGSCAMLPRDAGGVVDDRLRVYGCANLRVVDASVFPVVVGAGPVACVYALAEHAAKIMKHDLGSASASRSA